MLTRKLNLERNYSIKQIEYYFATGEIPIKPEPMNEGSSDEIRKDLAAIMERLERQEQFNQALVRKLDEQQHYIKESLNKRQLLLESLKASQEARKAEVKKKRFFDWFGSDKL